MKRIHFVLILISVLLLAGRATAQYYQYTDQHGHTCFTDDISDVPVSQRDSVTQFDSVKSSPKSFDAGHHTEFKQSQNIQSRGAKTLDNQMKQQAEALEQKNQELQETFQHLQEQKQALQQQSTANMTNSQRNAHSQKIREVNSKIKSYNKRREELSKKIKQFNTSLRSNPAKGDKEP
ncbi:MAG: DUF4124 domain-containing protein [Bacteroidota bacterium]